MDANNLVLFVDDILKTKQINTPLNEFKFYLKSLDFIFNISSIQLFRELHGLENDLAKSLMVLKSEKYLWEIKNSLRLSKSLFQLELLPEDYEVLQNDKPNFSLFLARLKKIHEQYQTASLAQISYDSTEYLNQKFSGFLQFYQVAKKRDQAFVDHLLEQMKEHDRKCVVLVTGGFMSIS